MAADDTKPGPLVVDLKLFSLEDPSDDMPNMDPEDPTIELHEAVEGDEGYCGRCAFWNAPEYLGDAGSCQIVTGTIDAVDVCLQFSARVEAKDMEADWLPEPGQGDEPHEHDDDEIEIEIEISGPAPTVEGDSKMAVLAAFQLEGDGDGFIVALHPAIAEAEALAQPDGNPADRLHVTLAYIEGTVAEYGEAALEALGQVADWFGPVDGEVVGLGFFGEDGFDSITVALVDALGLGDLRSKVVSTLKEHDVPVSEEHDFVPHITLAEGRIPEDAQVVGLPLTFDDLYLRDGEEVVSVALMGGEEAPEEDEMPEIEIPEAGAPEAEVDEERQARIRAALAAMEDSEVDAIVAAATERRAAATSCGCSTAAVTCGCGGKKGGCSSDPLAVKIDAATFAAVESPEVFTAIMSHETPTSDDPWDGAAQDLNVRSPEAEDYFAAVYAWRDDEADTSVKAAYRFIHHFVDDDGRPSSASTVACSAGIGVLNGARGGTTIPDADRQGVYDHLARHLRDADREPPELLADEDAATVARAFEAGTEIAPWDPASVLAALEVQRAAEEDAEVRLSAARVGAELTEIVAEAAAGALEGLDLTELGDEVLVAELARRWAEGVAAEAEEAADALLEAQDRAEVTAAEAAEAAEAAATLAAEVEDEAAEVEEMPEVMVGDFAEDDGYEWTGVLIVEGLPSGDGRMIAEGALTWRELPIPLMLQTVNAPGHDGSTIAGQIQKIERQGQDIMGWGVFDTGDAGTEYQRLLTEKTMRGVSADIDSVVVEFRDPATNEAIDPADVLFGGPLMDILEVLVEGRVMGATGTPFPAFQEAYIELIGDAANVEALVASAAWITETTGEPFALAGDAYRTFTPIERAPWVMRGEELVTIPRALVASAGESPEEEIPVHPPIEWFQPTNSDEPFTVHADGRITGLIARWGTCHIGNSQRCTPVPKSGNGYKHFRTKKVLTVEGELVATGPLFMDTVHPDLALIASDAAAHYHDTGCAVADVAVYDTELGIEVCGALRPDVTAEKIRALRGSDVSPDWRQIRGKHGMRRLEMVGLLAVNVSGFTVENLALVAAGGSLEPMAIGRYDSVSGEVTALVAAGMVFHERPVDADLREQVEFLTAELAELREAVRPLRAERAAAKFASRLLEAAQPAIS